MKGVLLPVPAGTHTCTEFHSTFSRASSTKALLSSQTRRDTTAPFCSMRAIGTSLLLALLVCTSLVVGDVQTHEEQRADADNIAKGKQGGDVHLQLIGENPLVLVGADTHYTDYGSVCILNGKTDISHEVHYDAPNIDTSKPGVHEVKYHCRDAKAIRMVVVKSGSLVSRLPGGWLWVIVGMGAVVYLINPKSFEKERVH